MSETGLYALGLIAVASVVTYAWRALGVALAGRFHPDGRVLAWVTHVAYAIIAALIARVVVMPIGPLAESEIWQRAVALAAAAAVFFAFRKNLPLGVAAGGAALAVLEAFAS